MSFGFDFDFDLVSFIFTVFAWVAIGYIGFRIYRLQEHSPKIWKIALVILIGIFSFSINFPVGGMAIHLYILPLGVWILYFLWRKDEKKWQRYRKYAWLGFWGNYLFLFATLGATAVHHSVYPADDPATYLTDLENAEIITIHPSGEEVMLDENILLKQLSAMEESTIFNDEWYEDLYMDSDAEKPDERFPYQVVGHEGRWGSNQNSIIYLEEDGKGILITTDESQYYLRSERAFLKRVSE